MDETAQTQADAIAHELDTANRLAGKCAKCGMPPAISYEAGATITDCLCRKLALPDWQPMEAVRFWNEKYIRK